MLPLRLVCVPLQLSALSDILYKSVVPYMSLLHPVCDCLLQDLIQPYILYMSEVSCMSLPRLLCGPKQPAAARYMLYTSVVLCMLLLHLEHGPILLLYCSLQNVRRLRRLLLYNHLLYKLEKLPS